MFDLTRVPQALHISAARYWEQFEQNRLKQNLPDLASLLAGRITLAEFDQQLTRVFAASEFIGKTCAINPTFLIELVESGTLFEPLDEDALLPFEAAINACNNDVELDRTLRQFRNKAMIRIIWRDINRCANMQTITAELSRFADACIQFAANYHYCQLEKMYGLPIGHESGFPQPLLVLGMGKLGARELNVSSDIDLIFTFPESGSTNHETRVLSNQEFFTKLGQKLINSLDKVTADGFVFRVDMRLRPHGQSGALVLNFAGMEDYYQTQGRDWERYAMIKARAVAAAVGSMHSVDYINNEKKYLRTMLRPFTYRQYIDFSAIESLREMKALIARQVQRKGMNLDVKLGEGGIREVEFVVQVFQLIRGGRDARLRKRQVMVLLPILEQEHYLPAGAGTALSQAYEFLRNTEHAIQGYQDRQTQALPTDALGQLRLAWVMGFENWDAFMATLNTYRSRVNHEFKAVIADPENRETVDVTALDIWRGMWDASVQSGAMNAEDAKALLQGEQLDNPEELVKLLHDFRENRSVVNMQASSRSRLDDFVPRLLLMISELAEQGELMISFTDTLKRVLPLVESVVRRSAYLVLLIENPIALHQLVKLCAASPMIAEQVTKYPALLDELLTPVNLYFTADDDHQKIKANLQDELRREVLRLEWDDLEGHMEVLRYFRSAHSLRVAAGEVSETLPLMKVSDYLTFIAEVILEHVLQLSWEHMVAKHGRPLCADGTTEQAPNFVIAGYGKLGGIELGHGSDLDLVFIHNADTSLSTQGLVDGKGSIDNLTFYARLGQRIIFILNTQTASGKLYETDMRLRPSGNSGMLVSTLAAFERYQLKEAWTWEHQALVRARVVAGSVELAKRFDEVRQTVLRQQRDLPKLRQDVLDMRLKMRDQLGSEGKGKNGHLFNLKQDAGGIVDIEFMVQYAALAWAYQAPGIVQYTDNIRILGSLEEAGLLDAASVAQLIAAYKAYRSIGHRLALQQQEAVLAGEHLFDVEREQVSHIWSQLIEVDSNPQ
jgi:glutamate-ammonia-ligase adenylyltransferase